MAAEMLERWGRAFGIDPQATRAQTQGYLADSRAQDPAAEWLRTLAAYRRYLRSGYASSCDEPTKDFLCEAMDHLGVAIRDVVETLIGHDDPTHAEVGRLMRETGVY